MKLLKKILVVEDSPPNRMILCHLLQKLGFEVFEASDGCEALEWLKDNQADLVLTDMMMPKVDGIELLKSIRADARHSKTPVFIVTALGEPDSLKKAEGLNCTGILLKPISVLELRERLKPFFPDIELLKRVG